MGVKGAEANAGKRNPSHSIVNAIGEITQGLQEGLIKAENTMAILLRTGIIGLKDWLY